MVAICGNNAMRARGTVRCARLCEFTGEKPSDTTGFTGLRRILEGCKNIRERQSKLPSQGLIIRLVLAKTARIMVRKTFFLRSTRYPRMKTGTSVPR